GVTSVDLVIVAAARGYGRRHGWLSNYHLAARDDETGRFEPVGKTFKGLTDAEFRAMTERLSALAVGEEGATVFVEPRVVVEVLFTDLQRSPTYRAGLALRFARITRIRDDKTPAEADTLEHLRTLLARQRKGGGEGEVRRVRVTARAASLRRMRSPRAMWWVVSRGLVVAALLTGRNAAGDEPPERVVQYAKDALTVRVTRVPVDEILGQLGKQSGAEIRGEVRGRHEITAEFEDVPLPEALHRLLG